MHFALGCVEIRQILKKLGCGFSTPRWINSPAAAPVAAKQNEFSSVALLPRCLLRSLFQSCRVRNKLGNTGPNLEAWLLCNANRNDLAAEQNRHGCAFSFYQISLGRWGWLGFMRTYFWQLRGRSGNGWAPARAAGDAELRSGSGTAGGSSLRWGFEGVFPCCKGWCVCASTANGTCRAARQWKYQSVAFWRWPKMWTAPWWACAPWPRGLARSVGQGEGCAPLSRPTSTCARLGTAAAAVRKPSLRPYKFLHLCSRLFFSLLGPTSPPFCPEQRYLPDTAQTDLTAAISVYAGPKNPMRADVNRSVLRPPPRRTPEVTYQPRYFFFFDCNLPQPG